MEPGVPELGAASPRKPNATQRNAARPPALGIAMCGSLLPARSQNGRGQHRKFGGGRQNQLTLPITNDHTARKLTMHLKSQYLYCPIAAAIFFLTVA